jgi:glyoxylase-like metal-dependent hydrolase (beta-lactamase superfamily II)
MTFSNLWRAALGALLIAFAAGAHAQGGAKPAVTTPRLYVFDGGVLASDISRYHMTAQDVQSVPIAVGAYLIVHPRGLLMWDSGAVTDAERQGAAGTDHHLVLADKQMRTVTLGKSLAEQFATTGYKPSDVTYLALSHYHWDHTANANAFANATWLVRPVERDFMFAPDSTGPIIPATYSALKNAKFKAITTDDYDVFGDGTVVIKSAPGHTPGHQVLYVKLAKTGGVLLSGDLYHYPEERTLNRFPTFEVDAEQTRAARAGIEDFLKKTNTALWIQHDLVGHRKLKLAPEFYE